MDEILKNALRSAQIISLPTDSYESIHEDAVVRIGALLLGDSVLGGMVRQEARQRNISYDGFPEFFSAWIKARVREWLARN